MGNLPIMADPIAEPLAPDQSLYQSFLAERDEILKHKWIKSEQAGADVGFETGSGGGGAGEAGARSGSEFWRQGR